MGIYPSKRTYLGEIVQIEKKVQGKVSKNPNINAWVNEVVIEKKTEFALWEEEKQENFVKESNRNKSFATYILKKSRKQTMIMKY